jgi:transcriptional regulator with XRE-family HTH domain
VFSWDRWFKRQLAERGMTQEEAARALGLSLATVNRWVNGRSTPTYEDLWKVRQVFGELPFG